MDAALEQVGPRLRAARRARGWTLEVLAERSGTSASTISRLESGKRQASLELLLPLVRRLGIRIDDLLPGPPADPRVRRAPRRADGVLVAPLTLEDAPVQGFKLVLQPVAAPPEPRVHDGFEWVYVLSGRLRLELGGQEHLIEPGEAVEFDTRVPHAMSATAEGPAEVLSIFSPAGERMHTHGAG
ncbi:helix-turn-helix domain-containing protein [Amnibacterium endophyticum]|uniref:Helix-turn-helix domain-containing protein n=1 Tax=Amnibacterium endophyticum TaxID=2109337 RepID=A0ABW4LH30_9MICO